MTNLTKLDEILYLSMSNTIVLIVYFTTSGILSGITLAVMDCDNCVKDLILSDNLFSLLEGMTRESL